MLLTLSRRRQFKLAHRSDLLNGTRDYLLRDELLGIHSCRRFCSCSVGCCPEMGFCLTVCASGGIAGRARANPPLGSPPQNQGAQSGSLNILRMVFITAAAFRASTC